MAVHHQQDNSRAGAGQWTGGPQGQTSTHICVDVGRAAAKAATMVAGRARYACAAARGGVRAAERAQHIYGCGLRPSLLHGPLPYPCPAVLLMTMMTTGMLVVLTVSEVLMMHLLLLM